MVRNEVFPEMDIKKLNLPLFLNYFPILIQYFKIFVMLEKFETFEIENSQIIYGGALSEFPVYYDPD